MPYTGQYATYSLRLGPSKAIGCAMGDLAGEAGRSVPAPKARLGDAGLAIRPVQLAATQAFCASSAAHKSRQVDWITICGPRSQVSIGRH